MLNIKIKYFPGADRIAAIDVGDWIDLRVNETVMLKKGDFRLLPLGVAMALPKGYEALLVPRSSTFKKYGIIQTNSIGVIDETYCGDDDQWMMPVLATNDVVIPKGTRICQFRILKHQPKLRLVPVLKLDGNNRGGFGSTGEI